MLLFLHNNYGTSEFPDCGNLLGADWMENLRWANTEPSIHFRETNTEPSMHFRKANTDPSMHFRKANTEFWSKFTSQLYSNSTSNFISVFTPNFNPKLTSNLLHNDKGNVICVLYIVFFSAAKYLAHSSQPTKPAGKDQHFRMFAPGGHPSKLNIAKPCVTS